MRQAEFASMSFEEQEAYIASMKQKWDYDNSIEFAEQKGLEKGREEGLEKGLEQKAVEIARKMLEKKKEMAEIVEFTGLTEEQIRAL